jgi:hypothetical protein
MTKKDFIALADTIRSHNKYYPESAFTPQQLTVLANYCRQQNSNFKTDRWLSYVAGECGPHGGAVRFHAEVR